MLIYQIIIEYDGTNFVGWQTQKNGLSVQETIQKALKKILKQKIILYGSGRTDSGVHALSQSAHFSSKTRIDNKLDFIDSVNFFLEKKKISILEVKLKKNNFHARYEETEKKFDPEVVYKGQPNPTKL